MSKLAERLGNFEKFLDLFDFLAGKLSECPNCSFSIDVLSVDFCPECGYSFKNFHDYNSNEVNDE